MGDTKKEYFSLDPFGNPLPQGMFYRQGVYYAYKRANGLRLKMSTGKRDFKSALRRYHEIMQSWNDGESGWAKQAIPTLEEYWREVYRPLVTVKKKTPIPKQPEKYRDDYLMVHVLGVLGRTPLDRINSLQCEQWARKRRASFYSFKEGGKRYKVTEGTVGREMSLLQTMFKRALAEDLIERNPWVGVERGEGEIRDRVLTLEEQAKIESVLRPTLKRWFIFLLGTGLRIQELCSADPREVSFAPGRHFIRVTRKSRGLKKTVSCVPLIDPHLLDLVQEQLSEKGELWPRAQNTYRVSLATACAKVGVEGVSPHTLRHTFATRYLQGGGDVYHLSKILGHASVKTTEKIYAHLLPEDLQSLSQGINLGLQGPRVVAFKREA